MTEFGSFEYGSSVVYGTDDTPAVVSSVEILTQKLLKVTLDASVVIDDNLLDPANFTVSPVSTGNQVRVLSIHPYRSTFDSPVSSKVQDQKTCLAFNIKVDPMSQGHEYSVTISGINTVEGTAIGSTKIVLVRATKVDSILAKVPSHFSTAQGSNIGGLLTAIGSSDDLIGGGIFSRRLET